MKDTLYITKSFDGNANIVLGDSKDYSDYMPKFSGSFPACKKYIEEYIKETDYKESVEDFTAKFY